MVFDFISWQGNTEVVGDLHGEMIAGWEFGASSGSIGTDLKGVHNAVGFNAIAKTSSNPSPIDTQSSTFTAEDSTYVHIPYNPALRFDNTSFTLAALVRFGGMNITSGYQFFPIFNKDMYSSPFRTIAFNIARDYGNTPLIGYYIGDGGYSVNGCFALFADSNWHLIIAEYKFSGTLGNTRQRLFLDNSLIEQSTPNFFIGDNSFDYALCTRFQTTSIPSSARGPWVTISHNIQYVYRWNRLLNSAEKSYLFNGGNFRYVRP